MGDPFADAALSSIKDQHHSSPHDLLARIEEASSNSDTPVEASAFAAHTRARRPPRGAGVLPLSWYAARDARQGKEQPQWLTDELARSHDDLIPQDEIEDPALAARHQSEREALQVQEDSERSEADLAEELAEERRLLSLGQDVFYRYSGGILLALLHFSLAGGFASPRLSGILRATGYLVPAARQQRQRDDEELAGDVRVEKQMKEDEEKEKEQTKKEGDKAWKRMIETTQWVLDVMETVGSLEAADSSSSSSSSEKSASMGAGRRASYQVRLLHARVRTRISSLNPSILDSNVTPINQADLLGTLLSFSAAPLASLQRMGLSLTQAERDAYLSVWRYVGYLMGVDDRLVRRYLASTDAADRAIWSSVENLFNEETLQANAASGDEALLPPTYQILKGIADRPPFHTSFELHCALTTSLVGGTLSRALGLPKPTLSARLKVTTTYLGMWFTTTFGRFYPRRRWEANRLQISRALLRRLIVWNLGMKRSLYQGHASGEAGMVEIVRDEAAAMKDVRAYQWLMREMIAVFAIAGLGSVAAGLWMLMPASL